jgi:hypothetical protein
MTSTLRAPSMTSPVITLTSLHRRRPPRGLHRAVLRPRRRREDRGLSQALAAVRAEDTLVSPKLDLLASVNDLDQLASGEGSPADTSARADAALTAAAAAAPVRPRG